MSSPVEQQILSLEQLQQSRASTFASLLGIRSSKGLSSDEQPYIDAIKLALMTITGMCTALGRSDQVALGTTLEEALAHSKVKARLTALKKHAGTVKGALADIRKDYLAAVRQYAAEAANCRRDIDSIREVATTYLSGPQSMIPDYVARANDVLTLSNEIRGKLLAADGKFQSNRVADALAGLGFERARIDRLREHNLATLRADWHATRTELGKVKDLKALIEDVRNDPYLDVFHRRSLDEALSQIGNDMAGSGPPDTQAAIAAVAAQRRAFTGFSAQGKAQYEELKAALAPVLERVQEYRKRMPAETGHLLSAYVEVQSLLDGRDYAATREGIASLKAATDEIKERVMEHRRQWKARAGLLATIGASLTRHEAVADDVAWPSPLAPLRATHTELLGLDSRLHSLTVYVEQSKRLGRLRASILCNQQFFERWSDGDLQAERVEAQRLVDAARVEAEQAVASLVDRLAEATGLDGPFEVGGRYQGKIERTTDGFVAGLSSAATAQDMDADATIAALHAIRDEANTADVDGIRDSEKGLRLDKAWAVVEASYVHLMARYELQQDDTIRPRAWLVADRSAFDAAVKASDWDAGQVAVDAFEAHRRELMGQVMLLQQALHMQRQELMSQIEDAHRALGVLSAVTDKRLPKALAPEYRKRVAFLATRVQTHANTLQAPSFLTQAIVADLAERLGNIDTEITALKAAVDAKSKSKLKACLEPENRDLSWLKSSAATLARVQKSHPHFETDGVKSLHDEMVELLKLKQDVSWTQLTVVESKYQQLVARYTRYMDAANKCVREGALARTDHKELKEALKGDKTFAALWTACDAAYQAQKAQKNPQQRLPQLLAVIEQQRKLKVALAREGVEARKALAALLAEADLQAEENLRLHKQFKRDHERLTAEIHKPWYTRLEDWARRRKSLDYGGPSNLLKMAAEFDKTQKYDEAFSQLRLAQDQIDAIVAAGITGGDGIHIDLLVGLSEQWGRAVHTYRDELDTFLSWFVGLPESTPVQCSEVERAISRLKSMFSPTVMAGHVASLRAGSTDDECTKAAERGVSQVHKYKESLLGEPGIALLAHCPIKGSTGLGSAASLYKTLDGLLRNFLMARPAYKG